jgi:low affinity Fe/Cu permease
MNAALHSVRTSQAAKTGKDNKLSLFGRMANATAHAAGRPATFMLCVLVVIVWAVSGPIFHYSDTWQLVINTGTTIVTFLMVFLIQNTQNRDGAALQAKLDELIRVTKEARDDYVGIEKKPEKKLEELREGCEAEAGADATSR